MSGPTVIQGFIPLPERTLYATLYRNAETPRLAVLMAAPFGEERKCAQRLLVEAARGLHAAGCWVLMVDLRGTGDSTGDHAEATLAGWQADLAAAREWLRAEQPGLPVALLGARLGGNLVARLALADLAAGAPAPAGLLLWAPLMRGKELLDELTRRKQIKEMMGGGRAASQADDLEARWAAGEAVDFDGFGMNGTLATELRELDLVGEWDAAGMALPPTMALYVGGGRKLPPTWQGLEERLSTAGAPSRTVMVREKPFWGRIETFESEEILRETLAFCDDLRN